ncbi:MAG: MBL fold metallo-hydrolase [Clostridiales bacterium]|nr:MBL fold metallo-hydrolase [Clostridiales bacterium]
MIRKFISGNYSVNQYIVYDETRKIAAIIDPATFDAEVIKFIEKLKLNVEYIILTHGHGDHILGIEQYKKKYDAKIIAHASEKKLLSDSDLNFTMKMSGKAVIVTPDLWLKDNETIKIGDINLKVLHTPGHTKGGICLLNDDYVITGDTLFYEAIGRYDLYGGNFETLMHSIKSKLMILHDDLMVYPGHGKETSIGYERKNNPFLNGDQL